jgi:hypothetical protein
MLLAICTGRVVALPRNRKPPEQLRRRNPPEQWTSLPAEGCKLPVPKWPNGGKATALWTSLWRLPVAAYWHEQHIEPSVVARYVTLALGKPDSPAVSKLETELGLTPAAMLRMRLVVEPAEDEGQGDEPDHYGHLRAAS